MKLKLSPWMKMITMTWWNTRNNTKKNGKNAVREDGKKNTVLCVTIGTNNLAFS